MGERPFISLSMIVKNEEAVLGRCLDSVKGLVDEIVIVDTGSTDRTVEIARSYGAQVHSFAWCDDFAAARNYALERTHGEWVLHLDADEVAVPTVGPEGVRAELAAQPEQILYMRVSVKNAWPDGQGTDIYAARRFFRNRPNVRWRRPIHEAVYCLEGDKPEYDASCGSMVIDHDGYANPRARLARGKNTRNMRILKTSIRESGDAIDYFYLAQEHSAVGQRRTALRLVKLALKKFGGRMRLDFEGALYCAGMRYALAMNKPEEAERLGRLGMQVYAYSEMCYLTGAAYLKQEKWAEAEHHFELALQLRHRVAEYQTEAGTGSWKALIQLGFIDWQLNRRGRARERIERAYAAAPNEALTNLSMGKIRILIERYDEARPYIERAIQIAPTMREAHLRLAESYLKSGDVQAAYEHLDGATREHPEVPELWVWLGNLLWEQREYAACVDVLGEAIAHHQDQAIIYHRLGCSLRELGSYEDAVNALAIAASLDPASTLVRGSLALAIQTLEFARVTGRAAAA